MIRRALLAVIVCVTACGCRTKPFPVSMRGEVDGDMNMTGNMNVTGETMVKGDVAMTGDLRTSFTVDNTASRLACVVVRGNPAVTSRIAVIDIDGLLVQQNIGGIGSMGENPVALFREKLDVVVADTSIVAVVLRIDSPGGGVAAVDQMCHDLDRFKATKRIPIVASLMGTGTGGAYLLATHADHVVAQPTSIVGGIGVILNLYNMEDAMGQYNIAAIPIKAGEQIDAGSPVRAMNASERESLQRIANSFHSRFTDQVHASRPTLRAPSGDASVESWFDGRVVTGQDAFAGSLVDAVGYLDDAIDQAKVMSASASDAAVVMLRRDNDRAYSPLDITPNTSTIGSIIPFSLPGLERSKLPTFLYLWQLEPTATSKLN